MASEHEKFRLQEQYTELDYFRMLGNLFPVGRIWGVLFRIITRFIQGVIQGVSPTELQDTVTGTTDNEFQDSVVNASSVSESLVGQWLSVFGTELHRVEKQVTQLFNELVPGLATVGGLLPVWERILGLSQTVQANPSLTETERQQAAHEKYTNTGKTTTEDYIVDYAASLGFSIYIVYQDAGIGFIMGVAIMGLASFSVGEEDSRIEIHFTGSPTNIELIKESLNAILPAHLIVIYIID